MGVKKGFRGMVEVGLWCMVQGLRIVERCLVKRLGCMVKWLIDRLRCVVEAVSSSRLPKADGSCVATVVDVTATAGLRGWDGYTRT